MKIKNNDIFIDHSMIKNDEAINSDVIPGRYAIATNIIYVTEINGVPCFLVYNYEPQISNTWYTFYSTINDFHRFTSQNYGSLITEFEDAILLNVERNRIAKAKEGFISTFKCESIEVDNLERNEYWLKYSKSKDIWTLYLFEFYRVLKVSDKKKITESNSELTKFIPLDKTTLDDVVNSKMFMGLPIVENVVKILKDEVLIKNLILKKA